MKEAIMPDITVNDSHWNSLSPDVQSQIQSIVSQQLPGATIVPDPNGMSLAEEISADDATQLVGLSAGANQPCIDSCNSARDVATASCALLGDPKAIAGCIVIVQIAAAICRSQC
jgi:hypothetical protein